MAATMRDKPVCLVISAAKLQRYRMRNIPRLARLHLAAAQMAYAAVALEYGEPGAGANVLTGHASVPKSPKAAHPTIGAPRRNGDSLNTRKLIRFLVLMSADIANR